MTAPSPARDRWISLAVLLGELVSSGVTIAQFREVQTDLEEAFMTAAKQGEAEGRTES